MENDKEEHSQIAVKVTAFVDSGVAELVTILNDIPNVSTFSSCEGKVGRNGENAHVYLFYGRPYRTNWLLVACFANKLAAVLACNGSYNTDITLEWAGDKDAPFISITLPPKEIGKVVKTYCDHMSEFSCDTLYRELHSSIECLGRRS